MKYAILQNPGHNRVYYMESAKLALSELVICLNSLQKSEAKVVVEEIKGVRYLVFQTEASLTEREIATLSKISFVFALFECIGIDKEFYLKPIALSDYSYMQPKISSILKYKGKTNELFTKMMLNVALLSSAFKEEENIVLLDPVSGRGTTLFEAAVYGFDAYGVELDKNSVHESKTFFKKYVQEERIKHSHHQRQIAGAKKGDAVFMQEFEYALTKEEFKRKQSKKLGIIEGNSKDSIKFFKPNTFHLIVGDLPYGIVHGNNSPKKSANITRNPFELLENCMESWFKVLKKGGVLVLAWNSFLVSRLKVSDLLETIGFQVLREAPYDGFEHMVDKSIKRDLVVAKKK